MEICSNRTAKVRRTSSPPKALFGLSRLLVVAGLVGLSSVTGMVTADAAGAGGGGKPPSGRIGKVTKPVVVDPRAPQTEAEAERVEALREFGRGSFDKLKLTDAEALDLAGKLSDKEARQAIDNAWRDLRGPVWRFIQERPDEWPPKWQLLSAESQKVPRKPISAFRTEFSAWLGQYFEAHAARVVRRLDGISKWQLDEFIRRTAPTSAVNFDSEVAHVGNWLKEREGKLIEARTQLSDSFRRGGASTTHALFRSLDEHEAPYWSAAHREFIKRHPPLERLRAEGWNFDATSEADLGQIFGHLGRPLPGGQPSLVYLLDPGSVVDAGQAAVMTSAFAVAGAKRQPPEFLQHDDLERFIAGYAGKSLIVVGHIDGPSFVAPRAKQPPLVLDIVRMMQVADAHRVLLVPIGCNSSRSPATFGFLREISTAEVATFLGALPAADHTIGDLFAAVAKIAPLEVKGRHLADHLEAVLRPVTDKSDQSVESDAHGQADAITIIRVPRAALAPAQPSPTVYQAAIAADVEKMRPWHDSGPLKRWRSFYRAHPVFTLFVSALAAAIIGGGAHALRTRVESPTKPAMRMPRAATWGLYVLAGLLLVASILRLAIEYWGWTIGLMLLVFLIAISEKPSHSSASQGA